MTPADLRTFRSRLGLSQAKLAARLDVDVMTISRWERGTRAIPPFLHLALERLAGSAKAKVAEKVANGPKSRLVPRP